MASDDRIGEAMHIDMCEGRPLENPQALIDEYIVRHAAKYNGEQWVVN